MKESIWKSNVNGFLSLVCVGCVALGAWLVILHVAFGADPIANAMAAQMSANSQGY